MKIAYLGTLISSDSDFPLIRELQKKKQEMIVYFSAEGEQTRGGIFSLKNVKKVDAIIPASEYEEFRAWSDYFDISNMYIVNNYHRKLYDIRSWLIWIKFIIHVKKQKVDAFHFVWPFRRQKMLLFFLRIKKVMTVHDPIPHSSQVTRSEEFVRRWSFRDSRKLLLLSSALKEEFIATYKLPREKVCLSRFGYYDWVDHYKSKTENNKLIPYIAFCGQIQSHKGVDVLLKAMVEVHKVNPALKCVVAGSGSFYFDIKPYKELDYIEIRNSFIEMGEMVDLVRNSLFTVCPYKDATQSGIVQITLSSGIPMIVTNVGSLPSSVKDGVTGLVVPPSDVDALAKAIIRLSSDDELITEFKNNIETQWKSQQGWDEVGRDYVEMYESLSS